MPPNSYKDLKIEPLNIRLFTDRQYFFADSDNRQEFRKSTLDRYFAQREYLGDLSVDGWRKAADRAIGTLRKVLTDDTDTYSVKISLSKELQIWRDEQIAAGRVLPKKGYGVTRLSDTCIDLMGIRDIPEAFLTNDALFGTGFMNFMLGAYDPKVLLSNYIVDSFFYWDHGYHRYFPDFEDQVEAAFNDAYARSTPGGAYRRDCGRQGMRYAREKVALEEAYGGKLAHRAACRLPRDEIIRFYFFDSCMTAFDAEAVALGSDVGGIVAHSAIDQIVHGVVDVGPDIQSSELFNGFLVTADVVENGGVITEDSLRRIYDAYAAVCARVWTVECFEPAARGGTSLICWQMQNERHHWLRKIVLGYKMIRKNKGGIREAVFEEAFDENFHTTGFSHPLENACNGENHCDQIQDLFERYHQDSMIKDLWHYLSEAPLEYASKGIIDEAREQEIIEGSRVALCRLFSYGLTMEISWIIGHASLHAWQVNYLFEASMFGSLLDNTVYGGVDWYKG